MVSFNPHPYGSTGSLNTAQVMYEKGDGVERNPRKALELFERAHAAGNARATSKLIRLPYE